MMRSKKVFEGLLGSINGVMKTTLQGVAAVFLLAVLGVAGVAMNDFVKPGADGLAQNAAEEGAASGDDGWGSESISMLGHDDLSIPLISLANACGLGASSCYKCHNGKRAGAASPLAWHTEHEKVNNSCVSCHGGNPRLMKEKMAHNKMVRNSLSDPGEYCFTCHQESNKEEMVTGYNSILGGGD